MYAVNAEHVELFLEGADIKRGSARNARWLLGDLDAFVQGKDFRLLEEEVLRRYARYRRPQVKASTWHLEKTLLKHFFRQLHGYRRYTYPPCVDWMMGGSKGNGSLTVVSASDLLTEEEVRARQRAPQDTSRSPPRRTSPPARLREPVVVRPRR